jgi:hypothetical protein
MAAAPNAASTDTTASSGVTVCRESLCTERVQPIQLLLDARQHGLLIKLRMTIADAVGHDTTRPIEETRPLEEPVLRAHQTRAHHLFAEQRVREHHERGRHELRFYQRTLLAGLPTI